MGSDRAPLWLPRPLTPEEEAYAARLIEAAEGKTVVLNAKVERGGRIVSEHPWFIGCMFVPPTDAIPPETADERQAAIVAGFRRLQAAGETWVREDEACGWAADWIESGEWRRT